jgi:hypothetical protein
MQSLLENSQEFVGCVAGVTSYFVVLESVGFMKDRCPISFIMGSLFAIPVFPVAYILGYSYPVTIPAFGAYKVWKNYYSNNQSTQIERFNKSPSN